MRDAYAVASSHRNSHRYRRNVARCRFGIACIAAPPIRMTRDRHKATSIKLALTRRPLVASDGAQSTLQLAKWGSGLSLRSSNPSRSCPLVRFGVISRHQCCVDRCLTYAPKADIRQPISAPRQDDPTASIEPATICVSMMAGSQNFPGR
jgi:hypothetical protein